MVSGGLSIKDFLDLVHAQGWHVVAPLVNGLHRNAQRSGQSGDAPELFDGVMSLHAPIKACFT